MATTPNYSWPIPDPTDTPNVPEHMGNLARAQDTTVKGVETALTDRVAAVESKNATQDSRLTNVESKSTSQDTSINDLATRLSRLELVLRGNFKFTDFQPSRIVNTTTFSELAAMQQNLTIPTTPPPHATHYIIHGVLNITPVGHGDFRLTAKLNGVDLGYSNFRPMGLISGQPNLVHMIWDVTLADWTPGDKPLTYWARNTGSGDVTEIHSARTWAEMV